MYSNAAHEVYLKLCLCLCVRAVTQLDIRVSKKRCEKKNAEKRTERASDDAPLEEDLGGGARQERRFEEVDSVLQKQKNKKFF